MVTWLGDRAAQLHVQDQDANSSRCLCFVSVLCRLAIRHRLISLADSRIRRIFTAAEKQSRKRKIRRNFTDCNPRFNCDRFHNIGSSGNCELLDSRNGTLCEDVLDLTGVTENCLACFSICINWLACIYLPLSHPSLSSRCFRQLDY